MTTLLYEQISVYLIFVCDGNGCCPPEQPKGVSITESKPSGTNGGAPHLLCDFTAAVLVYLLEQISAELGSNEIRECVLY